MKVNDVAIFIYKTKINDVPLLKKMMKIDPINDEL